MNIAITLVAAMLAGTGFVLQQHAAEQAPQSYFLRLRLITTLLHRPRWLAGVAVMATGELLSAWAIGHVALSLAEPLLTSSLIFALALAVPLSGQWPAGLYLAGLCLPEGGPVAGAAVSFGGSDRLVSDYMESEFLSLVSRRERLFLTRTAVLERMCGPLCEAVLGMAGSAGMLEDLAGSNLLLVPLDRQAEWYRYHHLFRDMLLAQLQRREPGLMPVLRRRAGAWCLDNGMPEAALEYFMAAGDVDEAARLVGRQLPSVYRHARMVTIQQWLGWLEDRGGIERHPMTAVLASFLSALMGRPVDAERWADAVERCKYGDPARPEDPAAEAWGVMVVRATLCRRGAEQMRADTDEAVRLLPAGSFLTPTPALLQGIARIMCGDLDGGDLSLLPHFAVQARIELARVHLALADLAGARTLMREVEDLLRRRPDLGTSSRKLGYSGHS